MEDEEETVLGSGKPSFGGVNDSTIEEKPFGNEEVVSGERTDFVSNSEELQFGGASSPIGADVEEAAVDAAKEEGIPGMEGEVGNVTGDSGVADAAEPVNAEERDEVAAAENDLPAAVMEMTGAVMGGGEKSAQELGVVNDTVVTIQKMVESVVAGEESVAVDTRTEMVMNEAVGDGGDNFLAESCHSPVSDAIVAKENEATATGVELFTADTSEETQMEMAVGSGNDNSSKQNERQVVGDQLMNTAEGLEPVIGEVNEEEHSEKGAVEVGQEDNFVPKLHDSQSLGDKHNDATAMVGDILTMDQKLEVEAMKVNEEEHAYALPDSQPTLIESSVLVKDEKGEDKTVMEEGDSMVGDKMEVEVTKSEDIEHTNALHDSRLSGSDSSTLEKDENDEGMADGDILTGEVKTEMEEKAEVVEAEALEVPQPGLIGAESVNSANDDQGKEVVAGEDTAAVATEIRTQPMIETTVAEGSEGEPEAKLDDTLLVGAVSPVIAQDDDDEVVMAEEETPTADTEMETETEMLDSGKGSGTKRKRGRNSKTTTRAPTRKTIGEDVCFICFDGGDLVLCDRRGCPKAYHPSCVNRDEAFFRAKGRWNCGWHLCSNCGKNAHYMCYTCTFSLCKGCIKDSVIFCVRGNKGFCETCIKTVTLIESKEQGEGNEESEVDFDDKNNWEYLFKDYWMDVKEKHSLTSEELAQAKNPWKGSDVLSGKHESPDEHIDTNEDVGSGSDNASEIRESSKPKRRKIKKRSKSEEESINTAQTVGFDGTSAHANTEWASKELLEFVMHMKNGDKSVLSQFDVQALLLEYIKTNKLRDPRRKSQIICDTRLENLFGKPRVGHFEMLKLLESHFLIKEDFHMDDLQGSVVDTEVEHDGDDTQMKGVKDRKRKPRKKGYGRGRQSNLDDYAAIDNHNITLIFLRRKLMEDLLDDIERFHERVVGTFVRIRISGSNQKQDIYRLVQVLGTTKADQPYKIGKRTTDIMLEILNLNKTESISIDTISNQEFTEDECKRLRQSIKCGLINRLTVGDILDKAMEIQAARVNDWLETEVVRLSHLRDRASEKGRRKELRECVEKLQLLKTPEERRRRLEEVPEIHADPNMDPSYVSEENDSEMDDNKREVPMRPRSSSFNNRQGREPITPSKPDFSPKDSWISSRKNTTHNWEPNRNTPNKNFPNKEDAAVLVSEVLRENSRNQIPEKEAHQTRHYEKPGLANNPETVGRNNNTGHSVATSSENLAGAETAAGINPSEKMWHYKDPSGKIQGPFSVVQLRKWSKNGYFPVNLRIWKISETEDDGILLTEALAGRFQKDREIEGKSLVVSSQSPKNGNDSEFGSANDSSSNLPSPTPKQRTTRWSGVATAFTGGGGAAAASTQQTPAVLVNAESNLVASSGFTPPANSHQLLNAITSLQNSQNFMIPPANDQNPNNPPVSTQNFDPNSGMPVPGQPLPPAYGQWGGVSAMPPPPPEAAWRPPPPPPPAPQIQGNQPNMQPWGMGYGQNGAPVMMPENQNSGWVGGVQGNPNMGWGGPPPPQMNWGPVQGGWVMTTGNSGNMNPGGWVAPPHPPQPPVNTGGVVQGVPPGNPNAGWFVPPANMAPPPMPAEWAPHTGNPPAPPPGNVNPPPEWTGGPTGNQHNSGEMGSDSRFSSGGRPWKRHSGRGGGSGGGGSRSVPKGQIVCPYHKAGRCIKGPACNFIHN